MDLKQEIRKLVELQEVDSRIYSLTREKDITKPAELDELKQNFRLKKEALSSYEDKLKQLQLKKSEKELDLSSKEDKVRKAQGQLYQLKTNKEYQAKLGEIALLKADVSILEEDILKILDEIDVAGKELTDAKGELSEEEKVFTAGEKKIKHDTDGIGIEINNLQDKRNIIARGIDSSILSIYDRLIKTRSGVALAFVEGSNCSACHMEVTAQKINEIKMYKELIFCDMCVRILGIKDDFS